jgi:hypothetical protein
VEQLAGYIEEALLAYSGCYDPDCDLFGCVAEVKNIKTRRRA